MTISTNTPPSMPPAELEHELEGSGGSADRSFRWLAYLAGGTVLAVLGLIAFTMATKSLDALRHMGLETEGDD